MLHRQHRSNSLKADDDEILLPLNLHDVSLLNGNNNNHSNNNGIHLNNNTILKSNINVGTTSSNYANYNHALNMMSPRKPVLMAILSCLLYSFCSIAMVITNKIISASVKDKTLLPQYSIIMFQCLLATIFVRIAKYMGWVEFANFDMNMAKEWLPLNILFIGMLCTSFFSLVYVSVPMVTIFKNMTNLLTVFGDWYFFDET